MQWIQNKMPEIRFNSKIKNDYIKLLTHEWDDFLIEMSWKGFEISSDKQFTADSEHVGFGLG